MASFVLHASTTAGLYMRLPEIQARLGISEGLYGLVLLALPLGVLTGSLTTPKRIEATGTRRMIAFGLTGATLLQIVAALAPSAAVLAAGLAAYGFVFAGANVTVNVEANRYEAAAEKHIMSRCHGWWALGFLVTSFLAAGAIRVGISPLWQFLGHSVVMVGLIALLILPMPESPADRSDTAPRRFAIPDRMVLAIGLWALASILMEGTTRGWIVIYVRDSFGASEVLAALALPMVVLTQTAGRFLGDGLILRFGLVQVARASAALLGMGILLIVLSPTVPLVFVGCLLIGFGIAITMPQGFAASSRLSARGSAEGVAGFATLSTLIGFTGPPLFGGLAEVTGLGTAFALVLPMTVLAFFMAGVLGRSARAEP